MSAPVKLTAAQQAVYDASQNGVYVKGASVRAARSLAALGLVTLRGGRGYVQRVEPIRRTALLKVRFADRMCFGSTGVTRPDKPTPEEAAEEQLASHLIVPAVIYSILAREGMIQWVNGWHLTDAGRAALEGK